MINQISQVIKFASPRKSVPWGAILFFTITSVLSAAIIFVVLGYQVLYFDRTYPGVMIAGARVNGMRHGELVAIATDRATDYLNHPVTVQVGNDTWTFTAQELGLRIDTKATADQAYEIGRQGNLFVDTFTQLSLLFSSRNIKPVILFNSSITDQSLQMLSETIDFPPTDAHLIINSAADVELISAQYGRRLHVGATLPLIEAAILNNKEPVAAVTQQIMPTITDEQAVEAYGQVKHLLSQPLVFGFSANTDGVEWKLTPDTIVNLVDIVEKSNAKGKPELAVEFDKEALRPYVELLAQNINQDAIDAQLEFDEEAGELIILQHSQDGHTLDTQAASERVAAAVASGSHYVELPVLVTPASIPSNDLENLGIKALVSEATSYFSGSSEGRMHNIALSASKFDGVIVPPGEIFSFNEHLGEVTKENGYDESLIIFGDRTTVGIGGGVCQVSTTVFRTALLGGFELVERWAHGYRVGWYETNSTVGLDATIYTPDVDFKFLNDTDHFLLIHTNTDLEAGTVTFKFYGTPTEREVIVGVPKITNMVKHGLPVYEMDLKLPDGVVKQVDWAKDGMDVSVTRLVKKGDQVIHEDEIVSRYQPWRAVYKVGVRR